MPAKPSGRRSAVLDPNERSEQLGRAGDRIRKLRNELGLTLSQFARAVGYKSHSEVSAWQDGVRLPKAEPLLAMHHLSGKTLAWILGLPDATERENTVTLSDGTSLTDAQVNEALRIRLDGALQARTREGDRTAKFLRKFLKRKRALVKHRSVRAELLSKAIALLVEDSARTAHESYKRAAPERIEWEVSRRLTDRGAASIARLGASLAETEIDYAGDNMMRDDSRMLRRHVAWAQYEASRQPKADVRLSRRTQPREIKR